MTNDILVYISPFKKTYTVVSVKWIFSITILLSINYHICINFEIVEFNFDWKEKKNLKKKKRKPIMVICDSQRRIKYRSNRFFVYILRDNFRSLLSQKNVIVKSTFLFFIGIIHWNHCLLKENMTRETINRMLLT